MAFHANGGLHHRAVLHARQDTSSDSTVKVRSTRVPTSRSSSSHTVDRTTSIPRSTTSTSNTPKRLASSSLVVAHPTSTSKVVTSTPPFNKGNIPLPSSVSFISSVPSSDPTAAADTIPTRKGSVAGGVIGTLAAIAVIFFIVAFIVRRTRKRRDRLNDARYFDKEKLERPGMVQGIAAGPGVRTPNHSRSPSIITNIEKALPPSPHPSYAHPQQSFPASAYGAPDPFLPPPGPLYNPNDGHQELGAPPIPGISGPAAYSPYTPTFSPKSARPNQTTPPGSPFTGGFAIQNPFATPPASDNHSSTPASAAWLHIPMGTHPPLLPGGAFGGDTYRDSGYSAAYSEAQVEQAYKVQVGAASMPKYEDLARDTPPPPFTPFDPATTVNTADVAAHMDPATVNKTDVKPLPPRPPSSAHTVYNPEEAYGGV